MDTTSSVNCRTKAASEAYEDAIDSIRLYAVRHPEWRRILADIQSYVQTLEADVGLHEPGT